jgi:hypothetical protein
MRLHTPVSVARSALVLVVLLSSLAAAAAAAAAGEELAAASSEEGWELLEHDDVPGEAYQLWARLPAGSKWREFRLTGDLDVPPAVAAEVAMDVSADTSRAAHGETRRVLRRTPDVIVTYVRVDFPLVADRDVTTHLERTHDAGQGEYRMVWHEAPDEGPPLEDGVVHMQRARGSWTFQPLAGDRTRVVFESYADLGDSLPAWIINPFMTGTIKSNLVDLRAAIARRGR